MNSNDRLASRRQLLKWLAGSPLLAFPGLAGLAAQIPPAGAPSIKHLVPAMVRRA
jgi:hypothetical protein